MSPAKRNSSFMCFSKMCSNTGAEHSSQRRQGFLGHGYSVGLKALASFQIQCHVTSILHSSPPAPPSICGVPSLHTVSHPLGSCPITFFIWSAGDLTFCSTYMSSWRLATYSVLSPPNKLAGHTRPHKERKRHANKRPLQFKGRGGPPPSSVHRFVHERNG